MDVDVVSAHRRVVAHGKPGTAADMEDMRRMHRPQELNVGSCCPTRPEMSSNSNSLKAPLLYRHPGWLRSDCGFDMAFCAGVSPLLLHLSWDKWNESFLLVQEHSLLRMEVLPGPSGCFWLWLAACSLWWFPWPRWHRCRSSAILFRGDGH
jgi:hypothetical protein